MNWNIENHIIFESLHGSQIYGTDTPESDKDYRGVCIPPREVREGLLIKFEQKDSWEGKYEDRVIYDLKKFLLLCKDANPNIIEMLFIPRNFWINFSDEWLEILDNYKLFVSKKVKYTFTGYAHSQLARIKRHRAWLLNPPKKLPTREEYGLKPTSKLNYEQMGAILTIPEGFVKDEYVEESRKEKAYREAKTYWDMYSEWERNRNKKRQDLEAKYGYDTKHAMHLVRLIFEGMEILEKGFITLPRPESYELQEVRNGLYTYDGLIEFVEDFDKKFDEAYDKSTLPLQPDISKINELYLKLTKWRT